MSPKIVSNKTVVPKTIIEVKPSRPATRGLRKSLRRGFSLPKQSNMPVQSSVKPKRSVPRNFVPVFSFAGIIALVVMSAFHLFAVNAYAGKGFEIRRAQAKIMELEDKNKTLLVQQAEMGSITRLGDVAVSYGLVPVTNEEFLSGSQLSQR